MVFGFQNFASPSRWQLAKNNSIIASVHCTAVLVFSALTDVQGRISWNAQWQNLPVFHPVNLLYSGPPRETKPARPWSCQDLGDTLVMSDVAALWGFCQPKIYQDGPKTSTVVTSLKEKLVNPTSVECRVTIFYSTVWDVKLNGPFKKVGTKKGAFLILQENTLKTFFVLSP